MKFDSILIFVFDSYEPLANHRLDMALCVSNAHSSLDTNGRQFCELKENQWKKNWFNISSLSHFICVVFLEQYSLEDLCGTDKLWKKMSTWVKCDRRLTSFDIFCGKSNSFTICIVYTKWYGDAEEHIEWTLCDLRNWNSHNYYYVKWIATTRCSWR